MNSNTTINITEIESLYREHCRDNKVQDSKKEFSEFLKFLELDLYDWVRENLKEFKKQ